MVFSSISKLRFSFVIVTLSVITVVMLYVFDGKYSRRTPGVVSVDSLPVNNTLPPERRRPRIVPRQTHKKFLYNTTTGKEAVSNLSQSSSFETNKERVALLEERCKKYGKMRRSTARFSMKADERYKYFFCFIPKVACTSWLKTLARAAGKKNPETTFVHTDRLNKFVRPLGYFSAAHQQEILRNHYKFMFVRHPFERLISAYLDKMAHQRSHGSYDRYRRISQKIRFRYRRPLHAGPVTFNEFTRYVLDPGAQESPVDRHWRPYYQICQPCRIHYNFIGHYETLGEDSEYVLQKLRFPKELSFYDNHRHRHSADRMKAFFSRLPAERVRRLYNHYRIDFELFGYEWPVK